MNKKVKYISTLATTGIMALTSFAGTVNAATSLGSYRDLVKGIDSDRVAPYVLQNNQDRLTINDIAKEYNIASFNGVKGYSGSTVVKTGDTFVADQENYEVIVYGDIASKDGKTVADGKVNSADANLMLKLAVATDKSKLVDNVNLEAADIVNDGKISSADANLALKFAVGKGSIDVTLTPETTDSNYTLELKSKYANNQNLDKVPVDIKIAKALSEKATLTLRVLDAKGNKAVADKDVEIPANMVKTSTTIDFTDKEDGKYTIQLIEKDKKNKETVVSKTTVELNTVSPAAAKVNTERTAWNSAKMSLASKGESDIAKVYYVVQNDTDTTAPTFDAAKGEFSKGTTKTVKATDSKVANEVVSTELEKGATYTVYYVLENSYGSISKNEDGDVVIGEANVLSDAVKEQQVAIDATKIVLPDLAKSETKFTWEASDGADGYIVTVYKDGKIIEEKTANKAEYDISDELDGAGKYSIEVVATKAGKKNSTSVMSKEVTVRALAEVTGVAFEVNQEGASVLSWKDSNKKEDVAEYTVTVYEYKEDAKDYDMENAVADAVILPTGVTQITDTKVNLKLKDNTVYKAVVEVVKKSTGNDVENSKPTELEGFYRIKPSVSGEKIDVNTITLDLGDITIKGEKVTNFEAKVYTVQTANPEAAKYVQQKDVTTKYEDGKLVISGLKADTQYAYKLIANAKGVKGESAYIEAASKTLKQAPAIQNKTVVENEKDAKAGTVYYDAANAKLSVDGAEAIKLDATYSETFRASVAVIEKLRAGDTISINGDKVELTLTNASTEAAIDFGDTVKGKTVIVNGKVFGYEISIDAGSEAKELRLAGSGAKYDLSGVNAEKVTLDAGVVIVGDNTYTVLAGKTVTVNGVKVSVEKDTEIKSQVAAGVKELEVTVRKETNALTFENVIAQNVTETEAKITFVGKTDLTDKQLGDITIKTTGGKVTVAKKDVNVSGALNVEVNSGEVDISDPALTGTKTVNVSNKDDKTKATVTVNTKMAAPVVMPAGTEIREYTAKDFETVFTTATAAEKELINQYMKALNLDGKNATIKTEVAKGATLVTIEFAEATPETTIGGLK